MASLNFATLTRRQVRNGRSNSNDFVSLRNLTCGRLDTVNGRIVGSLSGVIISLLIPTNYLPSQDAFFPVVAVFLLCGAITGMAIGIVVGMVFGLIRRWRS
jgi:hypothetical protein